MSRDRVMYRGNVCEVIEMGTTYVCLKCTYTGLKYMLSPDQFYKLPDVAANEDEE